MSEKTGVIHYKLEGKEFDAASSLDKITTKLREDAAELERTARIRYMELIERAKQDSMPHWRTICKSLSLDPDDEDQRARSVLDTQYVDVGFAVLTVNPKQQNAPTTQALQ